MTSFSIEQHTINDSELRLTVTGEVDLSTRDLLAETLHTAITAGGVTDITIDLDRVTFLDATGISALIGGRKLAAQYGVTYLVTNPHGTVHRVLEVTGVLRTLTERLQPFLLP